MPGIAARGIHTKLGKKPWGATSPHRKTMKPMITTTGLKKGCPILVEHAAGRVKRLAKASQQRDKSCSLSKTRAGASDQEHAVGEKDVVKRQKSKVMNDPKLERETAAV